MTRRLHLATARDEALVHEWAGRLRAHGIDAAVVAGDGSPEPHPDRWRILVPEEQWLRARALLGPAADQEID
ncbi:MAG TPA: hypothetical protein VNN12_09875 [Dehalococcoidia bacterium]|jgi:hypothetical protein|nr:hypothetical protein [Dehalococcoidia bacterium]